MRNHQIDLRQTLTERFDEGELRTLCFDLNIDFQSLPGEGKADKARELTAYLERHGRLYDLLKTGPQLRPDIAWDTLLAEWAQNKLDADMKQLRARQAQVDIERRTQLERQHVVNMRPIDLSHTFRDRLHEKQAIYDYLLNSSVRLISILGRGGMGKTALASYVMGKLEQGQLPSESEEQAKSIEGILYLSTRSTGLGLERIYTDIGSMLGEPQASELSKRWADETVLLTAKVDNLLAAIKDNLYVILLDNMEDELAQDGSIKDEGLRVFIERFLLQPGKSKLIITSREQVKVTAAAFRGIRRIYLHEGIPETEAIAMLRDLDPDGILGLRDAQEISLNQAAQVTQGIPRALEILAGILWDNPVANFSDLIADKGIFEEQVVERLVSASHQSLDDNDRRTLEALAVFDRPIDETAVNFLLHPWYPGLNVQASLLRLVKRYFVRASRATGQYSLHPLDQEYAYHHLPEDKDPNTYNLRNLELRAAEFYASIRKPETEWKSLDDLAPQLAEFEHRIRAADYDNGYRVLAQIDANYLHPWSYYNLLTELHEKLLGHLKDPGLQSANLGRIGSAYRSMGQIEKAIGFHEAALKVAQENGRRADERHHLSNLGGAYRTLRQIDRAIEFFNEAINIANEIGDQHNVCLSLGRMATAYLDLGQINKAIPLFEEALIIARTIGDKLNEGDWLGHLGRAYYSLGQEKKAVQYYEEALVIARDLGARSHEVVRLNNLGYAYLASGQTSQAIKLFKQALTIAQEIDYRRGDYYQLQALGRAYLVDNQLAEAQQYCEKALSLDIPERPSYQTPLVLGIIHLRQGNTAAGEFFATAVNRCQAILEQTADLSEAHCVMATATLGNAVCDPGWTNKEKRAALLAPILKKYQQLLDMYIAPSLFKEVLQDLAMIQASGIEGLGPIWELLEGAHDTG